MEAKPSTSANPKKSSQRVNYRETFERNFITPGRAMKEFLLKPSEVEGLVKFIRRSPYETERSILVYNRKDVESRAIEIWGSLENLEREKSNREHKKKAADQINYSSKKHLRESRKTGSRERRTSDFPKKKTNELFIIVVALTVDVLNLIFKLVAWIHTNSDSLLAEMIHSVADTLNQGILVYGICQRTQKATFRHPYGYSNMMYVVSLISGVGIFCLGSAVSLFKGILALTVLHSYSLLFSEIVWGFFVLGFAIITEGVCFFSTVVAAYKDAKENKFGFFYYALSGIEPGLTVILLEDFAAVVGNIMALAMLLISLELNSEVPDACGAILIGVLLGIVALFLIITNATALVGRSIRNDRLEEINKAIEADVMIRGIYDIKGMDLGDNLVRYKAEIDFDGAELTRLYLDQLDLYKLLETVKTITNIDELENFMVLHGEKIVDLLGGEIDRIECKVRAQFPEVRHMDLEIL